jgi:hypothetical protein
MSNSDMYGAGIGGSQGVASAGQGISLLSASGQFIAGVVTAAARLGGALATNLAAGLITLIKIGVDANSFNTVKAGIGVRSCLLPDSPLCFDHESCLSPPALSLQNHMTFT